jgi:O-antigen/teichoic acid export membrane protein
MLKLVTFALMAGGAAILAVAPWLFSFAFGGKYAGGLAVLPLTLTYAVWFGIIGIAQNYLWCAEKARLGSVAVLAGVVTNVLLNLLWLPSHGLAGAVAATAVANFVTLSLTCLLSHRCGMTFDPGTWLILMLPPVFYLGAATTTVVLVLVGVLAARGDVLLNTLDKQHVAMAWQRYFGRFNLLAKIR